MDPPPYSEKEHLSGPALNHPAGPPPYSMDNTVPSAMPPPYQTFYISAEAGPSQGLCVQPQPAIIITPSQPTKEPDFLAYSIFTMLFCFLPLGLTALVFSIQTREANKVGDQEAARRLSLLAQAFSRIAFGVGILLTFVYFSIILIYVLA